MAKGRAYIGWGPSRGVGAGGGGRAAGRPVDWRSVGEIAAGWLLTFPGCAALGYWLSRLFLSLV